MLIRRKFDIFLKVGPTHIDFFFFLMTYESDGALYFDYFKPFKSGPHIGESLISHCIKSTIIYLMVCILLNFSFEKTLMFLPMETSLEREISNPTNLKRKREKETSSLTFYREQAGAFNYQERERNRRHLGHALLLLPLWREKT